MDILAIMLFPITISAAENIDFNHSHSLAVTAVYEQKPISGMQFDAYLISTVDKNGELKVLDRYVKYKNDLDIRGKADERWHAIAQVLTQEIIIDKNLKPSYSSVTDTSGVATFTDIPMGLYFIMSSTLKKDSYIYTTSSFFVMLPEQDLSNNTWNYDVVANAKPEYKPIMADYEVIKVWEDDCHTDQRPKSITISLICDGEVYDTVTLPHNEAWSYTWKGLDTNHQYTVTEKKEYGYKDPEIQQYGNTFIVTNICDNPYTNIKPNNPNLPQTGQLWWPVPLLIIFGLLFVAIGVIQNRGNINEK